MTQEKAALLPTIEDIRRRLAIVDGPGYLETCLLRRSPGLEPTWDDVRALLREVDERLEVVEAKLDGRISMVDAGLKQCMSSTNAATLKCPHIVELCPACDAPDGFSPYPDNAAAGFGAHGPGCPHRYPKMPQKETPP